MAKRSSVEVPVKEVKQIDKWIYKIGERKKCRSRKKEQKPRKSQ